MGQKEVDQLRSLIQARANLLQKVKKAKGKRLEQLQAELDNIQRSISVLDEKQR